VQNDQELGVGLSRMSPADNKRKQQDEWSQADTRRGSGSQGDEKRPARELFGDMGSRAAAEGIVIFEDGIAFGNTLVELAKGHGFMPNDACLACLAPPQSWEKRNPWCSKSPPCSATEAALAHARPVGMEEKTYPTSVDWHQAGTYVVAVKATKPAAPRERGGKGQGKGQGKGKGGRGKGQGQGKGKGKGKGQGKGVAKKDGKGGRGKGQGRFPRQ